MELNNATIFWNFQNVIKQKISFGQAYWTFDMIEEKFKTRDVGRDQTRQHVHDIPDDPGLALEKFWIMLCVERDKLIKVNSLGKSPRQMNVNHGLG